MISSQKPLRRRVVSIVAVILLLIPSALWAIISFLNLQGTDRTLEPRMTTTVEYDARHTVVDFGDRTRVALAGPPPEPPSEAERQPLDAELGQWEFVDGQWRRTQK